MLSEDKIVYHAFILRDFVAIKALIILHIEGAQTTDFHPIILLKSGVHLLEKYGQAVGIQTFGLLNSIIAYWLAYRYLNFT